MRPTKSHKGLTFQLLYDQPTIQTTVAQLASQINQYYADLQQQQGPLDLVVVCVLKGAFMFYSDLVKLIDHEHNCQFVKAKSYSGIESTGQLTLETPLLPENYAGKHVLIVEDMQDTGNTLKKMVALFQEMKPKTIDIAVLIRRPDK